MLIMLLRLLLKAAIFVAAAVLIVVFLRAFLPVMVPLAFILGMLVMLRWGWRMLTPRKPRVAEAGRI
jgi:hypothetical protein